MSTSTALISGLIRDVPDFPKPGVIFKDITPLLAQAPAAKGLHHAYLGGLVEHILGCLSLARTAARLHKSLDRSLLLAAAAIFSQKDGTKTPVRRSGCRLAAGTSMLPCFLD